RRGAAGDHPAAPRVRPGVRAGGAGADARGAGRVRDGPGDHPVRVDPVDQRRRRSGDRDALLDPPARLPPAPLTAGPLSSTGRLVSTPPPPTGRAVSTSTTRTGPAVSTSTTRTGRPAVVRAQG